MRKIKLVKINMILQPHMSAKILKQHVTDGLTLADENGLPTIVETIETHHAKAE